MGVVLGRAARYSEAQQEFNAALKTCGEILKLRSRHAETLYLSGRDEVLLDLRCCKGLPVAWLLGKVYVYDKG